MSHVTSPTKVDLLITTRCTANCEHCFVQKRPYLELDAAQWKQLIMSMHVQGTRELVFTGGEPTLYPHLVEVLFFCKALGIKTTLSTNGLADLETYRQMLPYLDEIGISLDAVNEETNSRTGRGNDQIRRAMTLVREVHYNFPGVDLSIRTVVTADNFWEIGRIPDLIKSYGVDFDRLHWKIYEYLPDLDIDGFNEEAVDLLAVDFGKVVMDLVETQNVELFPVSHREPYMIIFPNGEVKVSDIVDDRLVLHDLGNFINEGVEAILGRVHELESEIPPIRDC